jgi:hypothetical protein
MCKETIRMVEVINQGKMMLLWMGQGCKAWVKRREWVR